MQVNSNIGASQEAHSFQLVIDELLQLVREGNAQAIYEQKFNDVLCLVRSENPDYYARLRDQLKASNKSIRLKELDRITQRANNLDGNAADRLVDIASRECRLYHDIENITYATYAVDRHREHWPIESSQFLEWLGHRYFSQEGRISSEIALKAAVATLIGMAKYKGELVSVFLRTAKVDNAYWLDLCEEEWGAIKITAVGWEYVSEPSVIFRRTASMMPLPRPVRGGDIEELWRFANIPCESRSLVLAWMLEALRPDTPYAVLELTGEQGTAKSSTQSVIRDLIDPNTANNRAAPRATEDIFVAAVNSHLVSLENISHLSAAHQDALCVIATGAGYSARRLYSNGEEYIVKLQKPVVLNGIAVAVTAQDLLNRTIHVELPLIECREFAADLNKEFEEVRPQIFGSILDMFVEALRRLPEIRITPSQRPRMADFARLGEALHAGVGRPPGSFLNALEANGRASVFRTLDASPVASACVEFLDASGESFRGTVKRLFETVSQYRSGDAWPKSPRGFSDSLRRAAPALRQIGIEARIEERRSQEGYICVLRRMTAKREERYADVHDVHEL